MVDTQKTTPRSGTAPDATAAAAAPAPADTPASGVSAVHIVKQPGGRPDQKHHNGEIERLKKEIDQTHAKIAQIRAALSGESTNDTPAGRRRAALKEELNSLRSEQAGRKGTRGKVFDELKQVQDDISNKVKALQQAKSKAPFKSTAELDAQISQIEAQIESGSMKIVEERKALNEVSTLKKSRKSVEQFGAQQKEIDTLRAKIDELRSLLDDPDMAAANKRYEAIKQELDDITKEQEKTVGSRSKLMSQRTALSKRLDELYQARRDRLSAYHHENDKYFARVQAERERRQEAIRKEREEAEHARQQAEVQQLRDDAAIPAFSKEIEDCDVLIRFFSGTSTEEQKKDETVAPTRSEGLPSLPSVPKPDAAVPEGAVVARKKGDEDDYFAGIGTGKKKGKGKKSGAASAATSSTTNASAGAAGDGDHSALNVPFGMLSALLNLSIPPPTSHADLGRVVDNIKLKREYFVSNQPHQTQENIRKAEEKIAALKAKLGSSSSETNNESHA